MNLTVKTLKGGKFTIEVDPSSTVAQVKTVVVSLFRLSALRSVGYIIMRM